MKKSGSDPRGGHVRLYWDLLDSPAWRCLTAADQRAYVALARSLRGSNNGDLALPLSVARHHGITSQTTLAKSLRALVAVGLIAVTRVGGCKRDGQRLPTLYRLTDSPVAAMPGKHIEACKASFDWRAIQTIAAGSIRIAAADRAAKEAWAVKRELADPSKTQTPVQKMDDTGPKSGLEPPATSPKNGRFSPGPVQKSDVAPVRAPPGKPALVRVC